MLAGGEREVAVPGDELFAFAVAADPFEFAPIIPLDGRLGCGREFDGGVGSAREQLLNCCEVGLEAFEGCRSPARGAAVGVDVPGVDVVKVERGDVGGLDGRSTVNSGEVGGDGVAVDSVWLGAPGADASGSPGEG